MIRYQSTRTGYSRRTVVHGYNTVPLVTVHDETLKINGPDRRSQQKVDLNPILLVLSGYNSGENDGVIFYGVLDIGSTCKSTSKRLVGKNIFLFHCIFDKLCSEELFSVRTGVKRPVGELFMLVIS
jgi:hypothetical protein